ncbi:MAG: release factor glutamine methyltransferase [Bacteroidia bacterium]|jgi:release factor glutamine methyltransferase
MYSSLNAIKQHFRTELFDKYSERESDLLFYRLLESFFGYRKTDIILTPNLALDVNQIDEINQALKQLVAGVPVQYIDNTAFFMEDAFYVDSSVLIPRPETEELVRLILKVHDHEAIKVLDVGTGSGIIAIGLSKQRPVWSVLACDISNEALVVARRNGREILNQSEVAFYKEDILQPQTDYTNGLDIIVSNPPYVLESDKKEMQLQVLDHEPHLALFVTDESALIFYEAIVNYAQDNLKLGGYLYFEVHEDYANEVKALLATRSYDKIITHEDLQGKPRIVCGRKG